MTDAEVLQLYIQMAPFWAEVLGAGCEVAVHDVATPEHSLIAICNNLSGREIGYPLTDLARELASRSAGSAEGYLTNYIGHSQRRDFLSSTYCVRNEGRLVGLLCVNKDLSSVQCIRHAFQDLLARYDLLPPQSGAIQENLDALSPASLETRVADAISQLGIPPTRMSAQEKMQVVHRLDETGVLMMKGAVAEIAAQLGVSVPTVYRYLNKKNA